MSIILTNKGRIPPDETSSVRRYHLCINDKFIIEFVCNRDDGLAGCLRDAANAIDIKRVMDTIKLQDYFNDMGFNMDQKKDRKERKEMLTIKTQTDEIMKNIYDLGGKLRVAKTIAIYYNFKYEQLKNRLMISAVAIPVCLIYASLIIVVCSIK